MELEELKRQVRLWSGGFDLVGETKEELGYSLSKIACDLMNEISDEERSFQRMINSLEIDEHSETEEA